MGIQSSGGLSDEQIDQMVRDAETFASKDAERRALIDAKNDADTLLYSADKSLSEHRDKLPADVVSAIETAIGESRSAKDGEDVEAIKTKINDVQQATMKIGEALNKASGGGHASAESSSSSSDQEPKEETK